MRTKLSLLFLSLFVFSSLSFAASKPNCKVLADPTPIKDEIAKKKPKLAEAQKELQILDDVATYEALFELFERVADVHISTKRAAEWRGADQTATDADNRLTLEILDRAIETGNIPAAVLELQETALVVEMAYFRRILDSEMLYRLEEALKEPTEHEAYIFQAIQKIKYRIQYNEKNYVLFRKYKAQMERLDELATNGKSIDARQSLENDPALVREMVDAAIATQRDLVVADENPTPANAKDPIREAARAVRDRVGIAALLAAPKGLSLTRPQTLALNRPDLKEMEENFQSDSNMTRMYNRKVKWNERKTTFFVLLTHMSLASQRMKLVRHLPENLRPLASFIMVLRADNYKRRIHRPQIFSILDSYPSDLTKVDPSQLETVILNKLRMLLDYSDRNNDKDDLLNTVARSNITRELWERMKLAVMNRHRIESNARKEALGVQTTKLGETSWGQILIRMDKATAEANKQGGFSLLQSPSLVSEIAVRTVQIGTYAAPFIAGSKWDILPDISPLIIESFRQLMP